MRNPFTRLRLKEVNTEPTIIIEGINSLYKASKVVDIIHNNQDNYYIGIDKRNQYFITKTLIDNPVQVIAPNNVLKYISENNMWGNGDIITYKKLQMFSDKKINEAIEKSRSQIGDDSKDVLGFISKLKTELKLY